MFAWRVHVLLTTRRELLCQGLHLQDVLVYNINISFVDKSSTKTIYSNGNSRRKDGCVTKCK